jgi:hypothetical protein
VCSGSRFRPALFTRRLPPAHRSLRRVALLTALLFATPGSARAKDRPIWEAGLEVEQAYTDNLQSNPAPNRDDDYFLTMTAGLTRERRKVRHSLAGYSMHVRGRVFYRFPQFNYVELEPGVVYRLVRTEVLLAYRYTPERILFDSEDDGGSQVFYHENLLRVGVGRRFGAEKRLDVRLFGEAEFRDFRPPDSDRTSFTPSIAASVRYRFDPLFMPRLGVEYARRDARSENFTRDEIKFFIGAESALPWWGLVVRVRYKRSWKDYTASEFDGQGEPNSNFGRDDDIKEYEVWLTAPAPFVPGTVVGARYRYQDGDSTQENHVFTRNEIGVGVIYTFVTPGP